MNSFKIITYLCFFILICSCATFKQNRIVENKIELTKENLHLINGTYQNNQSKKPSAMDYIWGSYYRMKEYQSVYTAVYEENVPYFVTLRVLNEKNVKATIKVNDSILKSFIIKGRIKNGYFEQRSKLYILPAIMVNVFYSSKFRIGLINDDKIITDFRKIEFGTVYLLSPFDNSETYYNLTHDRIYND